MTSAARISAAMIGLGRMGGPMADNALDAGFALRVFDVSDAAVQARVARGATAASTVAEACAGADVVAVVVFDDAQAIEVIAGPGGAFDTMAPSGVVVLHTTVTLETIDELARIAAERGRHFLDAGISGGEGGAQAGTLVTMVGGAVDAVERARPLIETYSRELVHAGPSGAGMALKLARNSVGYIMMAAGYEALQLATAAGVDPSVLRHVLEATDLPTMLYTPFTIGGPSPMGDDAPAGLRVAMEHTYRLADKDLGQALAFAHRYGIDLPAAVAARREMAATVRLPAPPA